MSDADDVTIVRSLLDTYFRGFDDGRRDRRWLASVLAPDGEVTFPIGHAVGLEQVADLTTRARGRWSATRHRTSNLRTRPAGAGVRFDADLVATHEHLPGDPGRALRIGATVSGRADRLDSGHRITELRIDLVRTDGDGPGGG